MTVYGFGNALVDHEILVSNEDLNTLDVKKSLMVLVDEARQEQVLSYVGHKIKKRSCGGSAANTIITCQQLGIESFYSYKVASDEVGQFFYSDLKKHGVKSNFDSQELSAGVTGKCMVMITPDAERSMETFLGITASVSEVELDFSALQKAKYFYIEGYLVASPSARSAALKAKSFCENKGIKTSLTFSDPGIVEFFRKEMQELVGNKIDLLFANEKEALAFTQTNTIEEAIEGMKAVATSFVITRSEKGAIAYDGTHLHVVEGFSVKAIDSTGAGDVFAGAFLATISSGSDYKTATRVANFAASKVVTKYGARLDDIEIAEVKKFKASLS